MKIQYIICKISFLVITGILFQNVHGKEDERHEKYPPVNLSFDKIFIFEKIEGNNPIATPNIYKITQNGRSLQVVNIKTNEKLYNLTAPSIEDLNPRLDRGFEGFKESFVFPSGDLLLLYFETTFVHYSRISETYTILPSFVKEADEIHQISGWNILTNGLLIAPCGGNASNLYIIYEVSSGNIYKVKVPREFKNPNFMISLLDNSKAIVEVDIYEIDGDIGHDPDVMITGSLGWYKIIEKP